MLYGFAMDCDSMIILPCCQPWQTKIMALHWYPYSYSMARVQVSQLSNWIKIYEYNYPAHWTSYSLSLSLSLWLRLSVSNYELIAQFSDFQLQNIALLFSCFHLHGSRVAGTSCTASTASARVRTQTCVQSTNRSNANSERRGEREKENTGASYKLLLRESFAW